MFSVLVLNEDSNLILGMQLTGFDRLPILTAYPLRFPFLVSLTSMAEASLDIVFMVC